MTQSKKHVLPAIPTTQSSSPDEPPPVAREFRAGWVATVGNIDWPSKPGLSTEDQQKEIIRIIDRAAEINLNALVLQVRTTADAFYDSKIEPWSGYLTGTQGKAPEPYYDPLKFWVDESHKRGIELHAWFNPYRTRVNAAKFDDAETHINKRRPDIAKSYGHYHWMDPGEPEAQEQSFRVFMDVVERYDVDGVHIDDYFYPYPEAAREDDDTAGVIPFPDDESYKKYTAAGGKLNRADWRRQNIDTLIHRIYDGIKARKKSVQFGISPFGIPRPGLKGIEYVRGFDQYDKLYADTVKWLKNGWCDYFVPQLYWKVGAPQQPYLGLLRWWTENNPKGRHIYGGLFTGRVSDAEDSWSPDEILGQIMITRLTPGAGGNVHFSEKSFDSNRAGISEKLRDGLYARQALTPQSPWLDSLEPGAPRDVKFDRTEGVGTRPPRQRPATTRTTRPSRRDRRDGATSRPAREGGGFQALTTKPAPGKWLGSVTVKWSPPVGEAPFVYVVYYKQGKLWHSRIVPAQQMEVSLLDDDTDGPATHIAVSAVDRSSNESKRTSISTGLSKPTK